MKFTGFTQWNNEMTTVTEQWPRHFMNLLTNIANVITNYDYIRRMCDLHAAISFYRAQLRCLNFIVLPLFGLKLQLYLKWFGWLTSRVVVAKPQIAISTAIPLTLNDEYLFRITFSQMCTKSMNYWVWWSHTGKWAHKIARSAQFRTCLIWNAEIVAKVKSISKNHFLRSYLDADFNWTKPLLH